MKICFGELERVIKTVENYSNKARDEKQIQYANELLTASLILRSFPLEIEDISKLRPSSISSGH